MLVDDINFRAVSQLKQKQCENYGKQFLLIIVSVFIYTALR